MDAISEKANLLTRRSVVVGVAMSGSVASTGWPLTAQATQKAVSLKTSLTEVEQKVFFSSMLCR